MATHTDRVTTQPAALCGQGQPLAIARLPRLRAQHPLRMGSQQVCNFIECRYRGYGLRARAEFGTSIKEERVYLQSISGGEK